MTGETRTYRAHPRYGVFALVSLIMAALLVWQLLQVWEATTLLFVAIAVGLAAWNALLISARVTVDDACITLHRALFPARTVEFRQLIAVHEEGRLGRAILLAYHPFTAQGLLELEHAEALTLPALVEQDTLFANLQQQVPV